MAIYSLRQRAEKTLAQPGKEILSSVADSIESGLTGMVSYSLERIEPKLPNYEKLPTTICHKDLHKGNILRTEKGLAIVDPDWVGKDTAAYDLAMTIAFECMHKDGFDLKKAAAIISGYDSVRQLTPEEKVALPSLIEASAMRFFMRRFVNVMTADPENIQRAPQEFTERLRNFNFTSPYALHGMIRQATAEAPEQTKLHEISARFQQFRSTPFYQHSAPALTTLAFAGANAARDVAQGKENSLERVQDVLQQLRNLDTQENKVQQLTVKMIEQMVTQCRNIALGAENDVQLAKL
jgi:Ser/Thr protein kinase RdoA (MazF antagonist)